jgi:MFS family permease
VAGLAAGGFAQNAGQLIAARGFQGIGIGGLQALVQIVMRGDHPAA